MSYQVKILGRAMADADAIYLWIAKRSRQGAWRWHEALLSAAAILSEQPHQHPLAPESQELPEVVRELLFKTPRGRKYRLLFVIFGNEVRIVSVRGPGQPPVTADDVA